MLLLTNLCKMTSPYPVCELILLEHPQSTQITTTEGSHQAPAVTDSPGTQQQGAVAMTQGPL